jgi:hypothetical protein
LQAGSGHYALNVWIVKNIKIFRECIAAKTPLCLEKAQYCRCSRKDVIFRESIGEENSVLFREIISILAEFLLYLEKVLQQKTPFYLENVLQL